MKKLYIVLTAAALLVAAGGLSYAAVPSADGTIHACFDQVSGQLRIFDPETNSPKACGSPLRPNFDFVDVFVLTFKPGGEKANRHFDLIVN